MNAENRIATLTPEQRSPAMGEPRSFFQLIADERCTSEERDALAWHLAEMRARATWDALRSKRYEMVKEPRKPRRKHHA